MNKKWVFVLLTIIFIALLVLFSRCSNGEITLPFSKTDTPTFTPTYTPIPTNTSTLTSTPTNTPVPYVPTKKPGGGGGGDDD